MIKKTKTTMMIMAAALLWGIGNVCALPLRILIEEQHAKIEPAIKSSNRNAADTPTAKRAKRSMTH
jgi:hypothetical protein